MQFSSLLGNDSVKDFLQRAISSRSVPNTLIFSGPEGVGKSLFAKILAMHVMYPHGIDPINQEKIWSKNHPDLHLLSPEGKWYTIAAIRNFLEESSLLPFEAAAKVFLFSDAEKMHADAANALLKTLEEPMGESYVILLTSKEEEILPTIRSRCVRCFFTQALEEDIVSFLHTKLGKSQEEARKIAPLALGSFTRAESLSKNDKFLERRRLLVQVLSVFSYANWDLFAKTLEEEDTIDWNEIFSFILFWYRDLHVIRETKKVESIFLTPYASELIKIQKFPPLEQVHLWIEEVKEGLERNIKAKVCLEELFFRLQSEDFSGPAQFRSKSRKIVMTM